MPEEKDAESHGLARAAGLMGEAVEAAAAGQALTLALLQAEMEAMAQLIPGLAPGRSETDAEEEARRREEEARIETDFDNMPV